MTGFYVVGVTATCQRLAFAATAEQAAEYIGTLPGREDGRYYIDGPCEDVVVLRSGDGDGVSA